MVLSRSLRRMVALAAATVFLACQGTMVAYARVADGAGSAAVVAQGSCHDSGQQTGDTTSRNTCQANCQSQVTSSSQSGANVFAAVDLPAITFRFDPIELVARSASPAKPPRLRVESPPLAILHCCLRN
jgi:hypothetical protein